MTIRWSGPRTGPSSKDEHPTHSFNFPEIAASPHKKAKSTLMHRHQKELQLSKNGRPRRWGSNVPYFKVVGTVSPPLPPTPFIPIKVTGCLHVISATVHRATWKTFAPCLLLLCDRSYLHSWNIPPLVKDRIYSEPWPDLHSLY